jgi:hypothetical protein
MGLLDGGLRAIFGAAFGGIYLSGTLHVVTRTDDQVGGMYADETSAPIKYQRDEMNDFYRAQNGIPATQVRILILQSSCPQKPKLTDAFTIAEGRFAVAGEVDQDPAGVYWRVRGEPSSGPHDGST